MVVCKGWVWAAGGGDVIALSDSSSEEDAAEEVYEVQEICLTLPAEHCRLLHALVDDHNQFLPVRWKQAEMEREVNPVGF